MKLTRLRLHGFKSFVEQADIPIEPGVTGIIGPNGCGKSNLIEALRFVMGESSYKAMRGEGMEDVIFSGSAGRPARNMAEVTLVAERNAASPLGPEPGETETIEITRRIERDAGSTYRINGREVRARDVQLLFADAATGAHSSALVRQGQVAELIAAKPSQRRGILEDAAGISGLHSRRGEAEGKLRAAEQNLERLDDVMTEIGTRLEGLRRQARQAIRYRRLSAEIRKAEAIQSLLSWDVLVARLSEAETGLAQAATRLADAAVAQAESAKSEAIAGLRLPELRERSAAAAAAVQRLRRAAEELDREEARQRARHTELASRRSQTLADLEHERATGGDAEAALVRLTEETAALSTGADESATRIAELQSAADEAAAAASAAESEFSAAAGALATAAAERSSRERAVRDAQAKLRRLEQERATVTAQRDAIVADRPVDAELQAAAAQLAAAEAQLARSETEAQAAEASLATARQTEARAREPHTAAERAMAALQAEARMLAELLDLEGAKRFRPLIDLLEVEPGYEQALVAALGDDLEAPLDRDAPAHWGDAGPGQDDPELPPGVESLLDRVKGPDTLTRRLRQVGVATPEQASALAGQLAAGQRLVTREGALWRWDGLRVGPESAAGARRLEQRNRVAALVQELKGVRRNVERAAALLDAAKEVRAEAERIDAASREALRDARKALDAQRAALRDAEQRAGRVAERLSAFAGALARIDADDTASRADLQAAGQALAALADTGELAAERERLNARLAEERSRANEARLAAERGSREAAERERRLAALAAERQRWQERAARAGQRAGELAARLADLDAEIAAADAAPDSVEAQRRVLLCQIGEAEAQASGASDALAAAETRRRETAEAARAALDILGEARERRARDEERLAAATSRKEELAARIRERFGHDSGALRQVAELDPDAPAPAPAQVEARLQKLKAERERLGGVNLKAEDEAREIDARLEILRTERADLQAAINRLREGIQSLNREGRDRLLTAFEQVHGHFRSLFQHLFGGGTAELSLTGTDDPLESGLDIVAAPPGKRPQAMSLLSGGEQALTAMSLIFAVFLTNPSPLCVLDEVDAPLDDANVERFCALVEEMRTRTETRFLVITHNPITMARMDRLFGVTMAERGVSQVVSVDLRSADRLREAS